VQLALAATLVPQLLDSAKFPLAAMLVRERLAVPGFDNVTLCAVLVVFVFWLANVRVVGETVALGVPVVVVPPPLVVLLPPPQATTPNKTANTVEAKATFQRLFTPIVIVRKTAKRNVAKTVMPVSAASGIGRSR
jgi:hypothetical protein